jgi:hypothetical protein
MDIYIINGDQVKPIHGYSRHQLEDSCSPLLRVLGCPTVLLARATGVEDHHIKFDKSETRLDIPIQRYERFGARRGGNGFPQNETKKLKVKCSHPSTPEISIPTPNAII